eukprot:CAMPEP_0197074792 /NCGR_PEP_ID=MMETSP1384-20130603/211287_1 /TAXON_ID=29189 /ORGANISM="Ammonia sp." /LENGTH=323 /DNA_ID=CAMNT_0042513633 /DNA_START=8 /DNA_END=980 /DNA_ORIENTATION=+
MGSFQSGLMNSGACGSCSEIEAKGTTARPERNTVRDRDEDEEIDLINIDKHHNDFAATPNEGAPSDDEETDEEARLSKLSTLRSDEKAVDETRVQALHAHVQKSLGHEDTVKLIAEQYNIKSDTEDDHDHEEALFSEAESDVDAEERAEIERRKTEQKAMNTLKTDNTGKAKVFRQHTPTPWDVEDVDNSMNEMNEHLKWMQAHQENGGDVEPPESQLYRHKSADKWDVQDVEQQKKEMQQHLVHLMKRTVDNSMNEMNEHLKWMQAHQENDGDVEPPESQLYRHKSADKWDVQDVEQQKKEMQQHLVHLMQANKAPNAGLNT